eukprot:1159737-Pelagomonas_calceolata.AAC.5
MDIMTATQCKASTFEAAYPDYSKWRSFKFPVMYTVVRRGGGATSLFFWDVAKVGGLCEDHSGLVQVPSLRFDCTDQLPRCVRRTSTVSEAGLGSTGAR